MSTLTLHTLCLHRNFYDTKILGAHSLHWDTAGTRIFESTGCDIETLQDEDMKYNVLLSVVNCVRKAVNKQTRWSIRRYGGLKKTTLGYAKPQVCFLSRTLSGEHLLYQIRLHKRTLIITNFLLLMQQAKRYVFIEYVGKKAIKTKEQRKDDSKTLSGSKLMRRVRMNLAPFPRWARAPGEGIICCLTS